MKTLILFAVLFSGPLFARYSSVDDGACSAKLPVSKMNLDEASCVGKDCSCYTKVFRSQIDGLASKRIQQVEVGLEETYIKTAVDQMQTLLDFDLLSSLGSGNLGGGNLPKDCSFDSLRTVLSCKSAKAKKITKAIQKKFFEMSDYYVEDSQEKAIAGKTSCLSPMEKRGISLISTQEMTQKRLMRDLKKIPESEWKKLLTSKNPLEEIQKSTHRRVKRLPRAIEKLPLLSAIFSDKESLKQFYEAYQKDKSGEFMNSFYQDEKVIGKVREIAAKKCKMIFESIDTLACKKTANYYVTDEDFNNKVFSYYPNATDEQKENNLENHLYYCESKRCLEVSCSKTEGFSPQKFLEDINLGKSSGLELSKTTNSEELLCPSLVCPMNQKEVSDFAKGSTLKSCEPLAKEKKNPMELYASLGCPGGESCKTPFAENLRIYASFWKASYRPNEVAGKPTENEEAEETIKLRKTKRSDFVEAFVGEVGKDIDAFFADDEPVNELAEENKETKEEVEPESNKVERKIASDTKRLAPRPTNTDFTGASRGFGRSAPTGFAATQIPVDVENGKVDTKIVEDAIDAAKESIAEAKKWQKAYRDSVNNREKPVVNNNYEMPGKIEAKLPMEVSTDSGEGLINKSTASSGRGGRKPASKTPTLVIDRSKLAELNKKLLEEFKIDPLKPFVLKVWIKEGKEKKLVEIPVENVFYNGKLILKPVKDKINSEIFVEVLNSPIFFDYRNMLAEREERRDFFKNVLPNVKKL